jgi:acyl-CoA synthetase (AMP-forming)/AMP-acid ligase II
MIEAWARVKPGMRWGTYWGQGELTQLGSFGWFTSLEDIPGGDPSWIGKPLTHLEIRVVDEVGNDAESGELICRTPSTMLGYFKDPEKTAATIRNGWVHTGDNVRIDEDGNLFFLDRVKDMIKTGGMNVSSQEVERTLTQHPAVMIAAVVGVPDQYWSEAVTAFVIPQPGSEAPDPDELRAMCKQQLSGYKVPKKIHVVEDLPRDPQGKILKRELRKLASASI